MSDFLRNPWVVGIGVPLVLAGLGYVARRAYKHYRPELPTFSLAYRDSPPTRSGARKPDHIICTWSGVLSIQSMSEVDAVGVTVGLPGGTRPTSSVPTVLRSRDESVRIEVETKRTFDMHKIFPRKYARSPSEEHPPDIRPETELYPQELEHLAVTIRGSTVAGQTFSFGFVRVSRETEELVAKDTAEQAKA